MCVNVHIHIVIALFLWRQCEHFWWLTFLNSFLNTSIVTKVPGIKPRTSHTLGRSSVFELHCSLGLNFKAGVMKPFPNMARGPVEDREVLSSDPDAILCRQLPTYLMDPCWHIVVLILSFLETMYRTCRKGFGYWQLLHTFFFIWVSAWNSYGNKSNLCVILCICLAFNNSPVYHIHPNSKRNMNHGSQRVQKEAKSNFLCNIQQASQSGGCIRGKEINQQKKSKLFLSVVFVWRFSSVTRKRSLFLQR